MNIINEYGKKFLKKDVSKFDVGDTVKVHIKISEEGKTRIQIFEGIVIGKKGSGVNEAFTVRRISYGEGVEKKFPLHAPSVAKIEVVRKGHVKRAKLYYLRGKVGKKTRVEERIITDTRVKGEDGAAKETKESQEGEKAE
ncbi:MAG: 50S ribosomal protein L19 [Candidatus Omnitrophica bacterium]|nr:50S ribosomal protein L19 [Candidatus Omnitrophota bacterium]